VIKVRNGGATQIFDQIIWQGSDEADVEIASLLGNGDSSLAILKSTDFYMLAKRYWIIYRELVIEFRCPGPSLYSVNSRFLPP